jgi:ribose transport system permease protein
VIALIVATIITDGVIMRPSNIQGILSRASIIGIVALGQTFVILTGNIDLSTGALFGFTIALLSLLKRSGVDIVLAVFITISIVAIAGLINGIIVAKTKIPSFIVTLATMTIFHTTALLLIGAAELLFKDLQEIIRGLFFFSPVMFGLFPILVWIVIVVINHLILNFTRFGLEVYALGGKESAAIHSGISIARVKILVFVISGLLSAIAAISFVNKIGSGSPDDGEPYLLIPIAAVILGGTSLYGGEGTIIGTVIGVITIAVITNLLNLLRVDPFLQQSILAFIILIFMFINQTSKRYLNAFIRRKHIV